MMARAGSEALLQQRERISTLTSIIRDQRMSMSSASRKDRLLDLTSPASSPSSSFFPEETAEFKEEDVWSAGESSSKPPPLASEEAVPNMNTLNSSVLMNNSNYGAFAAENAHLLVNGKRSWLPLESGLGLSALSRAPGSTSNGIGRVTSASRMIPQMLSSSSENGRKINMHHQSAPVNVPNWSKALKNSKNSKNSRRRNVSNNLGSDEDEDGDELDDVDVPVETLPPHILVARSQTNTFSVFEGAGRTLKGRDLSRVRNAVLKQTGFL